MLTAFGPVLLQPRSGEAPDDDVSTAFRRIDGDPRATSIICLPWRMPYRLAKATRLVPDRFLACYEMPRAIVSSEPELCIRALHAVVDDATRVVDRARLSPQQLLVVGLSIGNAPATHLASRLGARLCSIASADRGDLTLWESPASRHIRERAERKGYRLADFTRAFVGYHVIDNLASLAPGSRFVIGLRDEVLPKARREGLVEAVHRVQPTAEVTYLDANHLGTMTEAVRLGFLDQPASHLAFA
jgi:pimeloyl-ACP methyl ester carboxylesterase